MIEFSENEYFNISAYNLIDSLESKFEVSDTEKNDLNMFFQRNYGFHNELINILLATHEKIKEEFSGLNTIKLKLIDGDYFHENLLGVYINSSIVEDSLKLDNIEDYLYQNFDNEELDKIILFMEF